MRPIQMVNLLGQYEKIQEEIDKAVIDVVRSSAYINGPEVKAFQSELETYLDVKHVIPCANGTDALQICMMALGLKPGDEVITASFTYVATAEAIALLQLTPVLVDVNPETFNIDLDALQAAITSRTKAIVPVHLFGQIADMEGFMKIAKKHGLHVIEDAAQAIGATYTFADGTSKSAGCIGDFGTTSFFPSKNLGCYGDGGAIFTNNQALADKARKISNHGQSVRYYHDEIGVNSRLDSIQAAILRIKLRHLDSYMATRQAAATRYDEAFAHSESLLTPVRFASSTHVFNQYTLKCVGVSRDKIVEALKSQGIPAMIYYPVPLHMQKAYTDSRYTEGMFPVTEELCTQVFSLPIHSELNETEQEIIINAVLKAL